MVGSQHTMSVFLPEEIARIETQAKAGIAPQRIAAEFGLAHSTFRAKLANSGYRIIVRRELERIVAIEAEKP